MWFPRLHVEFRAAVGVCAAASQVRGLFECHPVRFWPISDLAEWSPQDLRAIKGTLWSCLCYLCECCCRKKGREKKNGAKQEKPESPQDGQWQQEDVPHVAVALKCLRKSAYLCVFTRLFMKAGFYRFKGKVMYIQNFRVEPVFCPQRRNWVFYLGFLI